MRVSYRPYRAVHSGLNAFPGFHPGLFSVPPYGRGKTAVERPRAPGLAHRGGGPGIALSPRSGPPFSLHPIGQNIVDAGQVAFALGAQPIENLRSRRTLTARRCSRREKMKIAPGETWGNRRPTTPLSRRAGGNQPHTYRRSKIVPPLRGRPFRLGRLPRVLPHKR